MIKLKSSLLLLSLSALLSACGGSKSGSDSEPDKGQKNPVISSEELVEETTDKGILKISKKRKVELKEDFSNIEEFKANINTYHISFEAIAGNYRDATITCSKSYDLSKKSFDGNFNSTGHSGMIEVFIDQYDKNETDFTCEIIENYSVIDTAMVKIKKSMVVSGPVNFTSHIGNGYLETLVIDQYGVLITEKNDVKLQVEEFISHGGKIVTFTKQLEDATADNLPGESGGTINIDAKKTLGKVFFELRGKNGGKQTQIPPATPKQVADPKLNGNCSTKESLKQDRKCYGKKGLTGFPGKDGFPGLSGGNTGKLLFNITNIHDIQIQVDFFPGKGSLGTKGAKGGLGGPGGTGSLMQENPPVDNNGCRSGMCQVMSALTSSQKRFPTGPTGDNGPDGNDGQAGANGIREESVITVDYMKFSFTNFWKNF